MFDPKPGDEGRRVLWAADRPHLTQAGAIVSWTTDHVQVRFDRTPDKVHHCLRNTLTEEPKK